MSAARFYVGDTRDVMATIPDGSIDLVLTSPPFLALRSYLPDGHESKHAEIGSEENPAAFLDVMLGLAAEWRRVLAPHGSIAIELGDTYSGSGGAGGDYDDGGLRDGQAKFSGSARRTSGDAWPLPKSLALIPELFRVGLAYGINPLTGQESPAGRWRVRNVVRWVRPNPPVGALGDKFRPATSEMVIACVSKDRWFDLDAVRGPYSENSHARTAAGVASQDRTAKTAPDGNRSTLADRNNDGAGAPPLDWWNIPTHPYPGSHYATWPPKLCEIPVQSMCPREVCTTCGEPRRRITGRTEEYAAARAAIGDFNQRSGGQGVSGSRSTLSKAAGRDITTAENVTLGWSVCDCPDPTYRPGVVLDPFAGSGTTLAVATGHGRDAIGIDIDERNLDLARERVGMFLDEVPA